MSGFLGEFECRIDTKCRVALPAALKKQIPPEAANRFVVNRGFERHLSLYPFNVWEQISGEINKLNLFTRKNREFARYFYRGATEVELDNAGRLLLPRRLMDYAGIGCELILLAYANRVECWDPSTYDRLLDVEPDAFSELAEEVFGEPPAPSYDETDGRIVPIVKRQRQGGGPPA